MRNGCKVMEFLQLFAQIIKCNVKPMIHYALNRPQPRPAGRDFQQAANFWSPAVSDCC